MKFELKGPLKDNIYNLMRGLGYHFLDEEEKTSEMNFVHPLGGDVYPRFHVFLKVDGGNLIINLHLDQKGPSYKGTPAHSGEYESGLVKKEAERIKNILK